MAQIKDVELRFEDSTDPTKKRAKVKFKLVFSASEAGKKYRYDIKLLSEDLPGDEEGAHPSQVISNYSFGFLPEKSITAQTGEHSFSHTRVVSKSKLNEDPGTHKETDPSTGHKFPFANWDDIFAEVTLRYIPPHPQQPGLTIKKRSPTKSLLLAS